MRPRNGSSGLACGWRFICGLSLGFVIGVAAGLLGVGGGEFRLPLLICLLGFPVPVAASSNLLVGILTAGVGLAGRLTIGISIPAFGVLVSMTAGSIAGALLGASLTRKIKEKYLRWGVGIILVLVGLKFIHEALGGEIHGGLVVAHPLDLGLAAVLGLLIGIICGLLGVAGGEYRIPALVYFFGMSLKEAGTFSLAVSLPTILAGAARHREMGHLGGAVLRISLALGISSAVGACLGASLLPRMHESLLRFLLGIVLLLATIRVVKP
ncbi:MAG: sulfite exporter TauE/SafE family protein [Candidatus Hadarchaeales archaeon]